MGRRPNTEDDADEDVDIEAPRATSQHAVEGVTKIHTPDDDDDDDDNNNHDDMTKDAKEKEKARKDQQQKQQLKHDDGKTAPTTYSILHSKEEEDPQPMALQKGRTLIVAEDDDCDDDDERDDPEDPLKTSKKLAAPVHSNDSETNEITTTTAKITQTESGTLVYSDKKVLDGGAATMVQHKNRYKKKHVKEDHNKLETPTPQSYQVDAPGVIVWVDDDDHDGDDQQRRANNDHDDSPAEDDATAAAAAPPSSHSVTTTSLFPSSARLTTRPGAVSIQGIRPLEDYDDDESDGTASDVHVLDDHHPNNSNNMLQAHLVPQITIVNAEEYHEPPPEQVPTSKDDDKQDQENNKRRQAGVLLLLLCIAIVIVVVVVAMVTSSSDDGGGDASLQNPQQPQQPTGPETTLAPSPSPMTRPPTLRPTHLPTTARPSSAPSTAPSQAPTRFTWQDQLLIPSDNNNNYNGRINGLHVTDSLGAAYEKGGGFGIKMQFLPHYNNETSVSTILAISFQDYARYRQMGAGSPGSFGRDVVFYNCPTTTTTTTSTASDHDDGNDVICRMGNYISLEEVPRWPEPGASWNVFTYDRTAISPDGRWILLKWHPEPIFELMDLSRLDLLNMNNDLTTPPRNLGADHRPVVRFQMPPGYNGRRMVLFPSLTVNNNDNGNKKDEEHLLEWVIFTKDGRSMSQCTSLVEIQEELIQNNVTMEANITCDTTNHEDKNAESNNATETRFHALGSSSSEVYVGTNVFPAGLLHYGEDVIPPISSLDPLDDEVGLPPLFVKEEPVGFYIEHLGRAEEEEDSSGRFTIFDTLDVLSEDSAVLASADIQVLETPETIHIHGMASDVLLAFSTRTIWQNSSNISGLLDERNAMYHVHVYRRVLVDSDIANATAPIFEPLGSVLQGSVPGDKFGHSISLSIGASAIADDADSNTVFLAVGVPGSNLAMIYHYSEALGDWVTFLSGTSSESGSGQIKSPVSKTKNGQLIDGQFGYSVALAPKTAATLVVAAPFSDWGEVFLYRVGSDTS